MYSVKNSQRNPFIKNLAEIENRYIYGSANNAYTINWLWPDMFNSRSFIAKQHTVRLSYIILNSMSVPISTGGFYLSTPTSRQKADRWCTNSIRKADSGTHLDVHVGIKIGSEHQFVSFSADSCKSQAIQSHIPGKHGKLGSESNVCLNVFQTI